MKEFDLLINLLRSDGSIIVNKNLIWAIGLKQAILYSELLSKYKYFKDRDRLSKKGYFYCTIEDLKVSTGLSRYEQETVIEELEELELIEKQVTGLPAKRYFKITKNSDILKKYLEKGNKEILKNTKKRYNKQENTTSKPSSPDCGKTTNKDVKNSQTSMEEIHKQDCEKFTTNNTNINNTNINNTKRKDDRKKSSSQENENDKITKDVIDIEMLIKEPHLAPIDWDTVSLKQLATYFLYRACDILDRQKYSLLEDENNIDELATNLGIMFHNFKMEKEDFVDIIVKFLEQYKKISGKYKYLGYITPNMMGNMELVEEILSNIDYDDYETPELDLKDREKDRFF